MSLLDVATAARGGPRDRKQEREEGPGHRAPPQEVRTATQPGAAVPSPSEWALLSHPTSPSPNPSTTFLRIPRWSWRREHKRAHVRAWGPPRCCPRHLPVTPPPLVVTEDLTPLDAPAGKVTRVGIPLGGAQERDAQWVGGGTSQARRGQEIGVTEASTPGTGDRPSDSCAVVTGSSPEHSPVRRGPERVRHGDDCQHPRGSRRCLSVKTHLAARASVSVHRGRGKVPTSPTGSEVVTQPGAPRTSGRKEMREILRRHPMWILERPARQGTNATVVLRGNVGKTDKPRVKRTEAKKINK